MDKKKAERVKLIRNCGKCFHMWTQKGVDVPKCCPRCKSYTWRKSPEYVS